MNRYTVSSLIGEGSFGRVYKATRKDDDQVVAIKVISKVRLVFNCCIFKTILKMQFCYKFYFFHFILFHFVFSEDAPRET